MSVCLQTCNVIKFPEVHLDVIPLHHHTAVGVGRGHRHVDVLLEGEDVSGHGLDGDGLVTHKVCGEGDKNKNQTTC